MANGREFAVKHLKILLLTFLRVSLHSQENISVSIIRSIISFTTMMKITFNDDENSDPGNTSSA